MCGIFGLLTDNRTPIDKLRFKKSGLLMHHRGPDAYGQWGIDNKVELGHVRLSILDLTSENNQPFHSACGNFVIVFNGEIYNYVEIKEELQSNGYVFKTTGDTEVLLNSFIHWGESCVTKFNGDWAFAIYNIQDETLFCSRDRFGVKPFNYFFKDGTFLFSSEIKSILEYFPDLKVPNYNVISNFCRYSLGAQIEETWFEGILRLLPAHNLVYKNGVITIKRYWDYPKKTLPNLSFEEAALKYQEIFLNAVKIRMRSDVPVGTTLSSGIDSGSIVSEIRKFHSQEHNTFTAVFKNDEFGTFDKRAFSQNQNMDEATLVKRLAGDLKLTAHLIPIDSSDFCTDLSSVIYHLESGHSSSSTIPLAKIMSFAKGYVSVVMEGQGADELLSGYVSGSFPSLIMELLRRRRFKQARKEFKIFTKNYSFLFSFKQFIRLANFDLVERAYHNLSGTQKVFGPKLKEFTRIKDYPFEPVGFSQDFNKEAFKLHTGGLVNLLHYGDAISLANSIESRLPFMDVNLVEFSFQLPYHFKMRNGLGKYIHRIAMKGTVPPYILENPIKFGFNTPLTQHFSSFDREAVKILLSESCQKRGIFDRKGLQELIQNHVEGKKNNSTILFRLLSVELWFRRFID